jgi:hypothetical protein
MTTYRHLPASAASVLLGTALLLACAPKAQAAESAQQEQTPTTTQSAGDAAKQVQTDEKPVQITDASSEEGDVSTKTSEAPVKKDEEAADTAEEKTSKPADQHAEAKRSEQETQKEPEKVTAPTFKSQAEDNKEKELPTNLKSALDYFFAKYKFLALPVDTAKGVIPDPRAVLANADEYVMPIVWQSEPDVSTLGEHTASIKITLSTEDGYNYDVEIPTTVTVHEKESDYAMVYGTPSPGKKRTSSLYYDTDQQKVIAKRVYYFDPEDENSEEYRRLGETFSAMNEAGADWAQIGYVKGTDKYTVPNDSGLIHEAEDQANLNEEEKRSFERFYNLAHHWGWGHYENYFSSMRILNDANNVWFVAAANSRDLPDNSNPMQGYWDPDHFDFSNGHLPDPRYFIKNFELMPAGTKAEWAVEPQVDENGLQNDPEIRVTTPDGNTTLVRYSEGDGFAKFGDFEVSEPDGVILTGDIPQV